jgi:hypothetical protein
MILWLTLAFHVAAVASVFTLIVLASICHADLMSHCVTVVRFDARQLSNRYRTGRVISCYWFYLSNTGNKSCVLASNMHVIN